MVNYYNALAQDVAVTPSTTSYFSQPEGSLDPVLFDKTRLKSSVRDAILSILMGHLSASYQNPESWAQVWLAGSGVSYNWKAVRSPADLDCLIGVDFTKFRMANVSYQRYSNKEIADMLNQGFKVGLHPETSSFLNRFELTFYVNMRPNIVDIKPYAAYSLTEDEWTVPPKGLNAPQNKDWEVLAQSDTSRAQEIVNRYTQHLTGVRQAPNDAIRRNHEVFLKASLDQAEALFDEIHEGRGFAFSPAGEGYQDFTNYRWQAGKQSGAIQALKRLKEAKNLTTNGQTYGVTRPSSGMMVSRSADRYI